MWTTITCPNCSTQFADDVESIVDGGDFNCPTCGADITITMTWTVPEPETAA